MSTSIPKYRPSLQGVAYGKRLLEALPDGVGVARVNASHHGDERAIEFSLRRCWQRAGLKREVELTGGAVVEVRISHEKAGFYDRVRSLPLKVGWTEKSVIRAVTRLHAWAVAELNRCALLEQLDQAAALHLADDRFGLAVEEQEKVWGVSDYTQMSSEEIGQWLTWVQEWRP